MKSRTISGLIILIVIFGTMLVNTSIFGIVITICSILGFRELFNIKYSNDSKIDIIKFIGYISIILMSIDGIFLSIDNNIKMIMPTLLLIMPIVFYNDSKRYNICDSLYIIGSIYFLGYAFNNIILLSKVDIFKCIFIFLVAFITDTYAYIGGSLIGKHNFTSISPKKTIEGSLVGTVMGCIISTLFYYMTIGGMNIINIIVMCFVLTILSQIGDLVFSSIKRYFGKKDFSNLIPGHGGILDRFDSVIFVVLEYVLLLSIL